MGLEEKMAKLEKDCEEFRENFQYLDEQVIQLGKILKGAGIFLMVMAGLSFLGLI